MKVVAIALLSILVPAIAMACPTCTESVDSLGEGATLAGGFASSIALMLLLPPALILGGAIVWRRTRRSRLPVLLVAAIILGVSCQEAEPLPELGVVPQETLIAHDGTALSLASLHGRVTVVDFMFSSCTTACPIMNRRIADLAERLSDDEVRFVSISVDPVRDTTDVLAGLHEKHGGDPRWFFATADEETVIRLSRDGFKLAAEASDDPSRVLHSSRFVLVDRSGEIRGYYDSMSDEAMADLERDARRLLRS